MTPIAVLRFVMLTIATAMCLRRLVTAGTGVYYWNSVSIAGMDESYRDKLVRAVVIDLLLEAAIWLGFVVALWP
jgi:hypothetical protein